MSANVGLKLSQRICWLDIRINKKENTWKELIKLGIKDDVNTRKRVTPRLLPASFMLLLLLS